MSISRREFIKNIECHRGIAHSLPAMYEKDPSAAMGPHLGAAAEGD